MKDWKYEIDSVWIDKKRERFIIEGWGVDLGLSEPLKFELPKEYGRQQTITYKVRKDVNNKFRLGQEQKSGFILEVEGTEPVEKVEIFSERGRKECVAIPKQTKQKILLRVDNIEKKDDHKTEVKGWAANLTTRENVEISVLNKDTEGISFVREIRSDVSQNLEFPASEKYGFMIFFDERWENQKVDLMLRASVAEKKVKLDLSKKAQNSLKENLEKVNHLLHSGIEYYQYHGAKKTFQRSLSKIEEFYVYHYKKPYDIWIAKNEKWRLDELKKKIDGFTHQPKISILVPVYNIEKKWLNACINSVKNQVYTNWELCIVDDHSTEKYIHPFLEKLAQEDDRIKIHFREENGHISKTTNDALAMASGEYVSLLDNDDLLSPVALYKVVECLNKNPEADFIYTDEDKIDEKDKRFDPFFKPDWSPDTLLSQNYICHFTTIKKSLVDLVEGFEVGLEGAQDYDLFLKCTEKAKKIMHIPEILYHWRTLNTSTAENPESKRYAFDAGKKAIENALERRGIKGTVENGAALGIYNVRYAVEGNPRVSIIIPTKDHSEDLKLCIDSIIEKTGSTDYEIIVVDNGSKEEETIALFDTLKARLKNKIKILTLDIPFNYSTLNNEAAKIASGEYLLLLNNDIEILTEDWLNIMLGYAQQPHIGAVGAKLYYNDNTVQHAGVVLGIGGVAGHSHKMYSRKNYGYFGRLAMNSDYGAVTAACLMVKKEKFDEVQGLNEENLAVAFNDVDFCIKLLDKGYYNVCLATVEAYHYESKSRGTENTKSKQKRFIKEINYMKETWPGYISADPFYNKNLTLHREDFSIKI